MLALVAETAAVIQAAVVQAVVVQVSEEVLELAQELGWDSLACWKNCLMFPHTQPTRAEARRPAIATRCHRALERNAIQPPFGYLDAKQQQDVVKNRLSDPAAAYDRISVVEHRSLAGRDRPLELVEDDRNIILAVGLNGSRRGLVAMTDFCSDTHRLRQPLHGDPVQLMNPHRLGVKLFPAANDHLASIAADLQNVQRRSGRNAQALALANRKVMNAMVRSDYLARRSHQLAGRIGQRFILLGKISVDEIFVISTGNKADFLRVRLLCKRQSVLLR